MNKQTLLRKRFGNFVIQNTKRSNTFLIFHFMSKNILKNLIYVINKRVKNYMSKKTAMKTERNERN